MDNRSCNCDWPNNHLTNDDLTNNIMYYQWLECRRYRTILRDNAICWRYINNIYCIIYIKVENYDLG